MEQRENNKDIGSVLKGWDYEPGTINVRKIVGADGLPKLQMRLDLGLLQMEISGRPDGARPHGCESLLEWQEKRLRDHEKKHGTELGFALSGDQCRSLQEEAAQYYYRYLSLFVLEEFQGVIRDTARNLRVIEFCGKYAEKQADRLMLEQYRPYITMMNTRAKASLLFRDKQYGEALTEVKGGLRKIKQFYAKFGQEEAFGASNEVRVLKRLARDIRRKLPVDPVERLQKRLSRAVKEERYEEAAKLRDMISEAQRQGQ